MLVGMNGDTPARIKKYRLTNKESIRNEGSKEFLRYQEMIHEVTSELRRRTAIHLASERSPQLGGGANIYSEIVRHDGAAYFLKTTELLFDNELAFHTALMSGMIAQESIHYVIPKPVSITQIEGFRVYTFPHYQFQPLTNNDFTGPRRHDLIRCIAEFNAAHLATPELRQVFRVRRYTCRISAEAIEAAFPQHQTHECRVVHQRIATIFEVIGREVMQRSVGGGRKRKQSRLCLCINDFSHHNVGLLDAEPPLRFALLDMGQACLAPLGADLRWFFHYMIRQGSDLSELRPIASDYHRAIAENGVESSIESICMAALAAYADKRFNLKLLRPESDAQADRNWQVLLQSIDLVERCLAELQNKRSQEIAQSVPA